MEKNYKNKMLNASQIIEENLLKLEHTQGKPAQVGYDLSIKAVNKVDSDKKMGKILKDKTLLAHYEPMNLLNLEGYEGWILHPGVYDIMFHEGCNIPNNRVAFIKQRSSLYRNGVIINSPVFDPGFKTDNMGTFMYIHESVFIEKDSRVAQIYFHECDSAEMYNGQWQNDKQRQ
jgi:deoxycytidine triphosphate deaminase